MKALTLTAPYGTLIAIAAQWPNLGKHHETRGPLWRFRHRGQIAIHQGKNLKPVDGVNGLADICNREPFLSTLGRWAHANGIVAPFQWAGALPLGAVVAVASIAEVYYVGRRGTRMFCEAQPGVSFPLPEGNDRAFGDYAPGRRILKLEQIQALPHPVETRGYQGLWDLPADVEQAVVTQLRRAA